MKNLQIIQIIICVLLSASILLQQRGNGLGSAFGSDSSVYTSRRGAEKILYFATIIFGILFVAISVYIVISQA